MYLITREHVLDKLMQAADAWCFVHQTRAIEGLRNSIRSHSTEESRIGFDAQGRLST